jgi:hypothetical protein
MGAAIDLSVSLGLPLAHAQASEQQAPAQQPSTLPPPESGVSDRKTTRALEGVRGGRERTDVPSARPTCLPDADMEALATACLHDRNFGVPRDMFVPLRTAAATHDLDHRSAFLLLHVDGRSTLADIAHRAQLPLEDVVTSFFGLVEQGAVELTMASDGLRAPESGVFARTLFEPDSNA